MIRILVVDDDDAVRGPLADGLSHALSATVKQAESVQKAISFLEGQENFDVIVSDYSMPELTGLDLLLYIGKKHPLVPFVFFTGTPLKDLPNTSMQFLGAVQKPDANRLYALIKARICQIESPI